MARPVTTPNDQIERGPKSPIQVGVPDEEMDHTKGAGPVLTLEDKTAEDHPLADSPDPDVQRAILNTNPSAGPVTGGAYDPDREDPQEINRPEPPEAGEAAVSSEKEKGPDKFVHGPAPGERMSF